MGAHPYWYFVPYQPDLDAALQALREREFQAGRYNPVIRFPAFPVDLRFPSLGAQHRSMDAALASSGADGTRSILDVQSIGKEPDFGVAVPFDEDKLVSLFGTAKPTQQMIEDGMDFLEEIERGHCVYIIAYKDDRPDEIFFAGYSFD